MLYHYSPLLQNMPRPQGEYGVGNVKYSIQDTKKWLLKRPKNRCNLDIFYPITKKEHNEHFLYQKEKLAALKAIQTQLFKKLFWYFALLSIYTYTEPNSILSKEGGPYPVIIFLPGIGDISLYNAYLEELASHGFVVCAIEPPYDTYITVSHDGEIILLDPNFKKAVDEQDRIAIYNYRNQAHDRWKMYIQYALETLKKLEEKQESFFYNMLDLGNIGLLGHSHGGAVVTDLCQNSDQYQAGVNMDGWTKTYNTASRVRVPFLFLANEKGFFSEMEEFFQNNTQDNFEKIIVNGASHLAFSDYILLKFPLSFLFGIVTKNASQVRSKISKFLVSFFNEHLKAKVEK